MTINRLIELCWRIPYESRDMTLEQSRALYELLKMAAEVEKVFPAETEES